MINPRLLTAVLLCLCASVHAGAVLEISEFSKPGTKKTLPVTSDQAMLLNIEFFTGWSHCEVSAGALQAGKQPSAWLRCWSQDESQVGVICQRNERQTLILGHGEDGAKTAKGGSIALVCSDE